MKIPIAISLVVFGVAVTAILTAGLVFYQEQQQTEQENMESSGQTGSPISLSLEEVAKHNKQTDCWMVIANKVYNVTGEIASHPGGGNPVIIHCGTDATTAFATKDRNSPHSSFAQSLLNNCYIGDLNQNITTQQLQTTQQQINTNSTNLQNQGEQEDEYEYEDDESYY